MIHQLKVEDQYFYELAKGYKTFEVRKNDRDFRVGDYLGLNLLEEQPSDIDGICKETGEFLLFQVTNMLTDSTFVKEGYVVMSIAPCSITVNKQDCVECYSERC